MEVLLCQSNRTNEGCKGKEVQEKKSNRKWKHMCWNYFLVRVFSGFDVLISNQVFCHITYYWIFFFPIHCFTLHFTFTSASQYYYFVYGWYAFRCNITLWHWIFPWLIYKSQYVCIVEKRRYYIFFLFLLFHIRLLQKVWESVTRNASTRKYWEKTWYTRCKTKRHKMQYFAQIYRMRLEQRKSMKKKNAYYLI